MKLSTAPEKAGALGAGASSSAARLYNDIEQELALGDYSEEDADAGEHALSVLEERFPGVRAAARNVTTPPALSHSANRTLGAGDKDESSEGGEGADGGEPAAPRSRSSSTRSRSGSSSSRVVVERAAGVSGEDVSGAIITGLQFLLAAGLAYQVLQPKGAGAFASVLSAIGRGVKVIVDPVDPFAGLGSSAAPPAAGLTAAQVAQEANVAAAAGTAPGLATSGLMHGAGTLVTGPIGSHVRTHVFPTNVFPTPTR